jgi:hypothetical protein
MEQIGGGFIPPIATPEVAYVDHFECGKTA